MAEHRSPLNGQPLPRGTPFTKDDERAANAGRKSGKKRRELCTMREQLEMLLAEERPGKDGKTMTVQEGITSALVAQAVKGNVKAYEIIRDTLGQKPTDKVELKGSDFSALDGIIPELVRK